MQLSTLSKIRAAILLISITLNVILVSSIISRYTNVADKLNPDTIITVNDMYTNPQILDKSETLGETNLQIVEISKTDYLKFEQIENNFIDLTLDSTDLEKGILNFSIIPIMTRFLEIWLRNSLGQPLLRLQIEPGQIKAYYGLSLEFPLTTIPITTNHVIPTNIQILWEGSGFLLRINEQETFGLFLENRDNFNTITLKGSCYLSEIEVYNNTPTDLLDLLNETNTDVNGIIINKIIWMIILEVGIIFIFFILKRMIIRKKKHSNI